MTMAAAYKKDGVSHEALLLICPQCKGETFVCYLPAEIRHVHFQCVACGTSFCDGCTEEPNGFPP